MADEPNARQSETRRLRRGFGAERIDGLRELLGAMATGDAALDSDIRGLYL